MPYLGMTPEGHQRRLRLLSMALRVGNFGYFVQDVPTGKITWAPETYRIWGVEHAAGIPNRDWVVQTIHPDDRAGVLGWELDLAWVSRIADFRILRPDGEVRHIRAHMERERWEDGTIGAAYGLLIDQTDRRQEEAALQQSEARFETLFETAGAGIVITSARARILFINNAFAGLLGYSPSELLGRSIRDLSPPETNDVTLGMVESMRAGRYKDEDVEKPYLHKNGELIWARLTISRHLTSAGEEEFIGVVQDLTSRHRAEQHLRDNENLLNIAQSIGKIGHWVWWPDKNQTEWSEELCRIVGYPADQRIFGEDRMRSHIHPDDMPNYLEALDKLMNNGGPLSLEYRIVRCDGVMRDVVGRATSLRDTPWGRRMIGTIQDITESKAREEALRRESLKAEAANRAKSLFLANMSHELRTPLNAILGFGQLLAMGMKGALNPDQKSYVDNVVRGGEHLLKLINDVLDLSRIDSGHFPLAIGPVNVNQVCAEVMGSFGQLALERGVHLRLRIADDAAYMVDADQVRLTQVVMNLVSNAVKYNRDGGEVVIAVGPSGEACVRVAVSDTGQGIPLDRHAEVFQHFNRLGAEAQAVEGTGIGLALSKRLVEGMKGSMGFVSEPNVATMFWFDLPRAVDVSLLQAAQ
jgi:PAS domain S-box-containing protein